MLTKRDLEELSGIVRTYLAASLSPNPPPFDRVIFEARDVPKAVRLHEIMEQALHQASDEADERGLRLKRQDAETAAAHIREVAARLDAFFARPRAARRFIVTGSEANLYYSLADWMLGRWGRIRRMLLEAATDLDAASEALEEARQTLVRLLKTGRPS